jgi:hypothetical protein
LWGSEIPQKQTGTFIISTNVLVHCQSDKTTIERNCLARPEPVFQGKIEGSPLHMPKIGPWRRKKLLISWEKPGVDALNNYD